MFRMWQHAIRLRSTFLGVVALGLRAIADAGPIATWYYEGVFTVAPAEKTDS